ncbi:Uncharacterised protein [Lysinibacillus capsici]|uniref:Uncharacterized protein n=1 Tax=Lysinibacillus capsici TaxID=2115968 RepID=A0A2X1A690_9BACI|nr:hypothetical protein [Lysinibacillus capsici]SPU40688.1 Uncharacterised protein [Lysinibacillus capsici]
MSVYVGENITEIETGKTLKVSHDFDKSSDTLMSHAFDFLATYEVTGVVRGFF